MTRPAGDRGQVTPFVVVIVLALLLCAGLVLDGGRLLAARRQAGDVADGAARAAAQEVSVEALRQGNRQALDPASATAAAQDYLRQAGYRGIVVVRGDSVTVRVDRPVRMLILGAAGLVERTVTATGVARTVRGIGEAES